MIVHVAPTERLDPHVLVWVKGRSTTIPVMCSAAEPVLLKVIASSLAVPTSWSPNEMLESDKVAVGTPPNKELVDDPPHAAKRSTPQTTSGRYLFIVVVGLSALKGGETSGKARHRQLSLLTRISDWYCGWLGIRCYIFFDSCYQLVTLKKLRWRIWHKAPAHTRAMRPAMIGSNHGRRSLLTSNETSALCNGGKRARVYPFTANCTTSSVRFMPIGVKLTNGD